MLVLAEILGHVNILIRQCALNKYLSVHVQFLRNCPLIFAYIGSGAQAVGCTSLTSPLNHVPDVLNIYKRMGVLI